MQGVVAPALGALLMAFAGAALADASRVSAWVGMPVVIASGERIGELRDVLFDARDGAIVAFTVDYGRWLRIAEHEAAFGRAQFTRRGAVLELAVPEARLRRTRALERTEWPIISAAGLIGREVRDRLHRDSGELVDLELDFEAGRVRAALIDLPDEWSGERAPRRVALGQLTLPREVGQFPTLSVRREQF
jgi:sporulation protein YlmC with PRC-barrel domain